MKNEIWPLIIISDRYSGVYSGGNWVAWHCYIHQLNELKDQESSDSECQDFWDRNDLPHFGKGKTIEDAINELRKKLEKIYDK